MLWSGSYLVWFPQQWKKRRDCTLSAQALIARVIVDSSCREHATNHNGCMFFFFVPLCMGSVHSSVAIGCAHETGHKGLKLFFQAQRVHIEQQLLRLQAVLQQYQGCCWPNLLPAAEQHRDNSKLLPPNIVRTCEPHTTSNDGVIECSLQQIKLRPS
eukprot:5414490-Amphidinium_carterae.1